MNIIENYYDALFTKPVHAGDINPEGEVNYKGYDRIQFSTINGINLENIVFPEAEEDYSMPITHLAIMDGSIKVVWVFLINSGLHDDWHLDYYIRKEYSREYSSWCVLPEEAIYLEDIDDDE